MTPVAQPTPTLVYRAEGDDAAHPFAGGWRVVSDDGLLCMNCTQGEAEMIVLACNSFDALTEANARQRELLEQINVAACYASEEDPGSAKEALLHIGELARDALKGTA